MSRSGHQGRNEWLRRILPYCLAAALATAMPGARSLGADRATQPPVILISVDTLRADHLGCYGAKAKRTAHIDTLANRATLFSQVSSQVPLTLPSHASLLSSTYPFFNATEDNGQQLGPGAVTLATVLKSSGYRTAAFVGGFVLDRRFGLHQGFDHCDSPFDLYKAEGKNPGDIKRMGADVVRSARSWIEENPSRSFPDDYVGNYNLGALAMVEGKWEESEAYLRAALKADPESSQGHNTLGTLHVRRGDLEAARQEFAEAVRLEPGPALGHYNLGLVLREQKKIEEAIREFRSAAAADPGFSAAREELRHLEGSRK